MYIHFSQHIRNKLSENTVLCRARQDVIAPSDSLCFIKELCSPEVIYLNFFPVEIPWCFLET